MASQKNTIAEKESLRLPELVLLVACDAAAKDPNTGKMTLYGVFDKIVSSEFPAKAQLTLFVRLRGGRGKHEITVEFVDSKDKPVGDNALNFMVECKKDMAAEFIAISTGMVIESPGQYSLRVRSGKALIGKNYKIFVSKSEAVKK